MTPEIDRTLADAQAVGVLSEREALALDQLASVDAPLPQWLFPAVERLYLWCECGDSAHN